MNFQDCIKFGNEVRRCSLATIDGDQPRVRIIGLCFADDTGFYFQTEAAKSFSKQLENNRKAEVVFWQPGLGGGLGTQMRVSGEVDFIDDLTIRTKVFQERIELLKGLGIEKPEDPELVIFRIYKGEAFFWTIEYNTRESEIERIKFGG